VYITTQCQYDFTDGGLIKKIKSNCFFSKIKEQICQLNVYFIIFLILNSKKYYIERKKINLNLN
jgi:hypothetical protein